MSLIARYTLAGNAQDSEGSAHGTAIDVTWAPSQLVDGGGEARLDGTTSRIETGITFTSETAVSLPIWFRPGQGAGQLIGQHDGTDGLAIEQAETGKIRLVVNGTASAEVTVYPGEYHHAVAVYDAGEATLYLDNEAVASVTETVTWPEVPVTIGARADGSVAFKCDLADVKTFDHALNENEVKHLSTSIAMINPDPTFIAMPDEGLVAFYTMDTLAGNEVPDEKRAYPFTYSGPGLVPAKFADGLKFRGYGYSDQGLLSGGIPLDKLTISLWVFLDANDDQAPIIGNWNSSGLSWLLDVSGGNVRWITRDGGDTNLQQAAITSGEWHHIFAKTDESGTGTLIVDNGQPVTGPAKYPLQYPGGNITLGRKGDSDTQRLDGILDQVRLYDTDLDNDAASLLFDDEGFKDLLMEFPYNSIRRAAGPRLHNLFGYNPHPTPVPNPNAIPRSGRSNEQGSVVRSLGHFDQRDGSGGSLLSPEGVVSRPDRQGVLEGITTDHNGNPVSRRVRCFERRTGRLVRETWSDAAGHYRFTDLDPGKRFTVVAHDHTGEYNAVIADNAQPEVPA